MYYVGDYLMLERHVHIHEDSCFLYVVMIVDQASVFCTPI